MFIKLNYRILLLAPWFVYSCVFSKYNTNKNIYAKYSILCFICIQWLIVLFSGNNLLLNYICANFYVLGLLVGNVYLQTDDIIYNYTDRKFLNNALLKFIATIGSICSGYLFSDIPKMVYMNKFDIGNNSLAYYHSNIEFRYNIVLLIIVIFSIYLIAFKTHIYILFERGKEQIYSSPLNYTNKAAMYVYNLVVISIFVDKMHVDLHWL